MKKQTLLIPKETVFPLICVLIGNLIVYYGIQPILSHLTPTTPETAFDRMIPLIPSFIIIYFLAFLQWFICYFLLAKEDKSLCYRFCAANIIAQFISMLFFILWPQEMIRPEVPGNDFCSAIIKLLYSLDPRGNNLFPSLHCIESWLCFRASLKIKKVGKWYPWFTFFFTVLVFASTVLVKQHYVLDIPGGVLVMELAFFLTKIFKPERVFEAAERRLFRKKEQEVPGKI